MRDAACTPGCFVQPAVFTLALTQMKSACILIASALQIVAAGAASAQERYTPLMATIDRLGDFLVGLFERSLRPDFATVAPGGGIGAGLTFSPRCTGAWCVEVNGAATVRSYWGAQGAWSYNARTTRVAAFAALRDMRKLDFFGVSNESDESSRANFRLSDRLLGLQLEQRLSSWLTLTGSAAQLSPDIGSGRSSNLPSIEALFRDADAPGLTRQPDFMRYGASLQADLPAAGVLAFNQGGEYRAAYAFYADRDLDRYSFGRFDLEFRQRFSPTGNLSRLTFHGRMTTTATRAGNDVPFYLMPTLGGFELPQAPVQQTLGSDGSHATLRGFTNYRFRDRHLLLLQAEYRMPLWGPADISLFADAGKVASARKDLALSHLHHDVGVALSIMRGPNTAARFDIAFGGEGTRLFLTLGRVIAP